MNAVRFALVANAVLAACSGTIDGGSDGTGAASPPARGKPGSRPAMAGDGTGVGPTAPSGSTAAPAVTAIPVVPPAAVGCGYVPARIYRLTPVQIRRSLASVLGASTPGEDLQQSLEGALPDAKPFSNGELVLAGSPVFVETMFSGLERSAAAALGNPAGIAPCLSGGVNRACVTSVLTDFGAKAWRRPWTSEEIQSYLTFFDAITAKSDPKRGLEYVLRRMLSAPDFLFRFELGGAADPAGNVTMTPDELASSLSYVLTDGPPDATLRAAASQRGLDTREGVAGQARRLLAQANVAAGVFDFFADLFDGKQTGHADQPEELKRFVAHVLWSDDGKLSTLLNADYTLVNPSLQKFYGWTKLPAVKDWEKITPPANEGRAGLLGSGLFLSRNTNRSARGKFIRGLLLCTEVPDPPANVNANLDNAKTMASSQLGRPATEDEARAAHMANPACAACHRLIDPVGKPLVAFDSHGVWQPVNPDTKKPYDTTSDIAGAGDIDGSVKDPRGLFRSLANARSVGDCMARQVYEYAMGRAPTVDDQCRIRDAAAKFAQSNGDMRQLFVDVVADDAFRMRSTRK